MKIKLKKISIYISKKLLHITRKDFLHSFVALIGSATFFKLISSSPVLAEPDEKLFPRKKRPVHTACDLAVVTGESPEAITRKAIEALGGMGRFVRKGDIVVIKPNIAFNRPPKYATTTNPEVVATLVKLCITAGAKQVKVFDYTANNPETCYQVSGIRDAVESAGGHISYINNDKFIPGVFPVGSLMQAWPIYSDAVQCDCFINVPIAKHHCLTRLTLSMKNLMGVCGENRSKLHWDMDRKLSELSKFINPDLTVIDAYRILFRNGPIGAFLRDVKATKTIIAGTDPVLADSYATGLFGYKPSEIGSIKTGEEMGLGTTNIAKANIKNIVI